MIYDKIRNLENKLDRLHATTTALMSVVMGEINEYAKDNPNEREFVKAFITLTGVNPLDNTNSGRVIIYKYNRGETESIREVKDSVRDESEGEAVISSGSGDGNTEGGEQLHCTESSG